MGGFKDILNAASLGVYKGDDESGEGTRGELEQQSGAKTWLPPRQSELQALRREVNALRIKTEEAEGVVGELRRQVEVLRETVEEVEVALRDKKAEEAEIVKRTAAGLEAEKAEIVERTAKRLAERIAEHATSQRSSDAQTPSRDDVSTSKERSFAPYPYDPPGGYPTPMVEGNPRTVTEKHWAEKQRQDAIDFGKGFKR
jgi:hypothetical protein